jgi:hypothetical protein
VAEQIRCQHGDFGQVFVGQGVPAPAVPGQSMDQQDLRGARGTEAVQVEFVVGHDTMLTG